jgi:hypothetical protein
LENFNIIIFIIVAILGSLLRGKKKEQAPQKGQPKPFTAEHNSPVKKLKEMSKEMYKEIQKELQTEIDEPPSRQIPTAAVPKQSVIPSPIAATVETIASPVRSAERVQKERQPGRLSVHGGTIEVQNSVEKHDLVPKTKEDFLKGIVFSEILAPPKSKR